MYSKVIKASVTEKSKPIITYEIEVPTWAWWDILTHRALSRNASSTRAIPSKKFREEVRNNIALPVYFTKNNKGMACNNRYTEKEAGEIEKKYIEMANKLIEFHEEMENYGISKQDLNILLTPFYNFRAVITATEWDNFFNLRVSPEAKPTVRYLATMMFCQYIKIRELIRGTDIREINNICEQQIKNKGISSEELNKELEVFVKENNEGVGIEYLKKWEYHLPYVREKEKKVKGVKFISVARCARVSYKTFETGEYSDIEGDIKLCDKLLTSGHYSPFEHIAMSNPGVRIGNFEDWIQLRKLIENKDYSYRILVDNDVNCDKIV